MYSVILKQLNKSIISLMKRKHLKLRVWHQWRSKVIFIQAMAMDIHFIQTRFLILIRTVSQF